jgi:hypothetical protein
MPFFTDPVSLNDATPTAQSYAFVRQEPDNRSIIGLWSHATDLDVAQNDILVKHAIKGTLKRSAVMKNLEVDLPLVTGQTTPERGRITNSHVCVYPPGITLAELEDEIAILVSAMSVTGYAESLMRGAI